jgi:hypothetical protein
VLGSGCAVSPCYPGVLCVDLSATGGASSYTCGACPVGSAGNGTICAACDALRAPSVSLSFTSPLLRSNAPTFYGAQPLPTIQGGLACSLGVGFTYAWTLRDGTGVLLNSTQSALPTLSLAAGALALGGAASASLTVCYAGAPALPCASAPDVPFSVVATPLIARISTVSALLGVGSAAVLDGSLSRDPDAGAGSALSYAWSCVAGGGNACYDTAGALLALPATPTLPLRALAGVPKPGIAYTFTLAVSAGARSASATASVSIIQDGVLRPLVSIAALSLAALNPSSRNVLVGSAAPAQPGDAVTLQWSMPSSTPRNFSLDLTSSAVSSTPRNFSSFVLLPNALAGGELYVFRLTALSTNASGVSASAFAEISVPTTAAFPLPGSLAVTWPEAPAPGGALATRYQLSAPGWSAPGNLAADLPLQFSFAYVTAGSGGAPTVLRPFQPADSASVVLPAGSLSLLVFVQSARGATTSLEMALATAVTVQVAPITTSDAVYAPPLVAAALAAASAGQADAALQLAGGLGSTFNAAPSTDDGRLLYRELLISAVGNSAAAAPPATASALQALAGAMGALTSAPSELNALARASAVSTLGALAGAGAAVNAPTAASVILSLSNVSVSSVDAIAAADAAAVADATAEGLPVLRGVLAAVAGLAASLQAQLSVAGEAPVSLSSPAISSTVALDLTTPDSRLFTQRTGAPGAPQAAFGPLPADALPAGLSAVNTSFHFLSFDPHSGTINNGSGSARLLLSGPDGAPLRVSGLAVPIAITLPPLPAEQLAPGTGTASVCTFWIKARQVYSADGCVGLPNPLPLGISAEFNASAAEFNASAAALGAAGAAELASAVVLGPSGHAMLAGCSVAVLDCAARGASAVFFLNPDDPFSAPAVRCPALPGGNDTSAVGLGGVAAAEAPPLRVYYGAQCALWRADNAAQCWWNATAQAFAGAGCVASAAPQQCLCRHVRPLHAHACGTWFDEACADACLLSRCAAHGLQQLCVSANLSRDARRDVRHLAAGHRHQGTGAFSYAQLYRCYLTL